MKADIVPLDSCSMLSLDKCLNGHHCGCSWCSDFCATTTAFNITEDDFIVTDPYRSREEILLTSVCFNRTVNATCAVLEDSPPNRNFLEDGSLMSQSDIERNSRSYIIAQLSLGKLYTPPDPAVIRKKFLPWLADQVLLPLTHLKILNITTEEGVGFGIKFRMNGTDLRSADVIFRQSLARMIQWRIDEEVVVRPYACRYLELDSDSSWVRPFDLAMIAALVLVVFQ